MELNREAVCAFMVGQRITLAAFARHAGIPYATMYAVMRGRAPRPRTLWGIITAMEVTPAPKLLKHAEIVRALWGEIPSEEIGRLCGVSGARIRDVAKRIGISKTTRHAPGATC